MQKVVSRLLIHYTADDEEPDCMMCDHVERNYEFCQENCGDEHGWYGYVRTENLEDEK